MRDNSLIAIFATRFFIFPKQNKACVWAVSLAPKARPFHWRHQHGFHVDGATAKLPAVDLREGWVDPLVHFVFGYGNNVLVRRKAPVSGRLRCRPFVKQTVLAVLLFFRF